MGPNLFEGVARTMTCREVTGWTSAYLDGRGLHVARNRMDTHLTSCAGCRAYVNQIDLVSKTLTALPGSIMDSILLDRLRQALAVRWSI